MIKHQSGHTLKRSTWQQKNYELTGFVNSAKLKLTLKIRVILILLFLLLTAFSRKPSKV